MPSTGDDGASVVVKTRVPAYEKAAWKAEAEEAGESLSGYVAGMVRAGRKKFDREVEPDYTNDELRAEVARLREENRDLRSERDALMNKRLDPEGVTLRNVLVHGPATYDEILTEVRKTAPARLTKRLSALENAGEVTVDKPSDINDSRSEPRYHLTVEGQAALGAATVTDTNVDATPRGDR